MRDTFVKLLLCVFLSPLICMAESIVNWEFPERKTEFKPHYKSCQGVDMSSFDSESEKSEKNTSTEANFKTQLRKRAIGQVASKIFQTKILRACLQLDKSFFKEREMEWVTRKV